MDKKDMVALIELEDELNNVDELLVQLTGMGHSGGVFGKLDNAFSVLYRNSHAVYSSNSEKGQELFFYILTNKVWSAEQRADILMNGTVRQIAKGEDSPI